MRILITGGCGYIGSHTILRLLEAGHDITVIDNLSNSLSESLLRVEKLTGREIAFVEGDIADRSCLEGIFDRDDIEAVIHFAGYKAVGESVDQPLRYYGNNVSGTLTLLETMDAYGIRNLVFSSSATVYGANPQMPLKEDFPLRATNPYGRTKQHIEEILVDLQAADSRWRIALLRYFNPVGAHPSGLIGEDPQGPPNNLFPFVTQVAVGRRDKVSVFGNDYPTADGTGVRDYIHVMDLAAGHAAALDYLSGHQGLHTWNLGTGRGYSVLEIIHAFEAASGTSVPYELVGRRPGDAPVSLADPSSAFRDLGWKASETLESMCADAWRWQQHNPDGYRAKALPA
ncbi:UDP-glucose 4-epimerase [Pseudarthrobacter chlorophenolicus A6]|uniref:UDP-glucose 4-epimerase n=1 Tax=Pseudarthrobacter chlorophenolicus (strain ATCC 700700 / DSM 12829 / CIP 107037 / JCM 12360 / KCTC 9906 / NCIMB 13794 / A6) TaxID=452863 RepID=B8HED0_PSECP|nr:UDP-glucose 4-epimerase GalE [Pseudarthrobacter chlorophenolicus]ACL40875.1 UDP-glucose 4-epimerase [Pseudarthrobacter chlorophenolicus A6]